MLPTLRSSSGVCAPSTSRPASTPPPGPRSVNSGVLVVHGGEVQRLARRGADADVEVAAAVEVLRPGRVLVGRVGERPRRAEHDEALVGPVADRAAVRPPLGAVEVDGDRAGPERAGEEVAVDAVADLDDLARGVEREVLDGAGQRELVARVEDVGRVHARVERRLRVPGPAPVRGRVEADVEEGARVRQVRVGHDDRVQRRRLPGHAARQERQDEVVLPVVARGVAVREHAGEEVAVRRAGRVEPDRPLARVERDGADVGARERELRGEVGDRRRVDRRVVGDVDPVAVVQRVAVDAGAGAGVRDARRRSGDADLRSGPGRSCCRRRRPTRRC